MFKKCLLSNSKLYRTDPIRLSEYCILERNGTVCWDEPYRSVVNFPEWIFALIYTKIIWISGNNWYSPSLSFYRKKPKIFYKRVCLSGWARPRNREFSHNEVPGAENKVYKFNWTLWKVECIFLKKSFFHRVLYKA